MRLQPQKWGIWNRFCKKSVLGTEVAQKGGGGGQPVGVCSGKRKEVLDAGPNRRRGVLGAGQVKKGGLYPPPPWSGIMQV